MTDITRRAFSRAAPTVSNNLPTVNPGLFVKTRVSGFENAKPGFRVGVLVFLTWPDSKYEGP